MTKDQFIEQYGRGSGISDASRAKLLSRMIALPCECTEESCKGWAMVTREPEYINDHLWLYAPSIKVWSDEGFNFNREEYEK